MRIKTEILKYSITSTYANLEFAIFKSCRSVQDCLFYFFPFSFPITETPPESISEPDEIGNVIQGVVYLAKQINLEVDINDVQKLLDFHNRELTMDELIEIHVLSL
ncbi:hypothetical protein TNCV_1853731 [Trichonephila clavipes]|nr:hypothetical protein TNCV_1853731 [Trichonephila clavipes]